jgi:hypothetical protein
MTDQNCLLHQEDPDRLAEHARSCTQCAAYLRELEQIDQAVGAGIESRPVPIDPKSLPLAPWEGAGHRSWPLLIAAAAALATLAAILFAAAGVGPVEGLTGVARALARGNMIRLAVVFGESLREAPLRFHLLIGVAFIAVNVLFIRLLRRAPRGADASTR